MIICKYNYKILSTWCGQIWFGTLSKGIFWKKKDFMRPDALWCRSPWSNSGCVFSNNHGMVWYTIPYTTHIHQIVCYTICDCYDLIIDHTTIYHRMYHVVVWSNGAPSSTKQPIESKRATGKNKTPHLATYVHIFQYKVCTREMCRKECVRTHACVSLELLLWLRNWWSK